MKPPIFDLPTHPQYLKFTQETDPFTLFSILEQESDTCFMLESLGEYSNQSRYTIIGFAPDYVIRASADALYIDNHKYPSVNPYNELKLLMPKRSLSKKYTGGLIGYLGYNAMNFIEPSLKLQPHPNFDIFKFGFYTDGIVFDKLTEEYFYFYYLKNRLPFIESLLRKKILSRSTKIKLTGDSMSQAEHKQIVNTVKEHISNGDTFQTQIGFKQLYSVKGDALPIYKKLRDVNPSPYMYYVKFNTQAVIGASPELLFRMTDGVMETFPLAGTIGRGSDERADRRLAKTLLNDPKEIAEHNMLVDLHRNDIGRVARFGTVRVKNLMDIKKFSHVQHISSEITGMLKPGEDMFGALAANFPAGTLTGAPKIESMKIIEKYETTPRGPYGGALGHFGFNGDCTFAIPIRTLFISGSNAFTQASGGIVYDSVADREYEEIQRKLQAMKQVMSSFS